MTKAFMGFVVVAILACSLVNITAASRILYAMARDRRFVAPHLSQKISAHHVPFVAIGFVTIVAVSFTLLSDSLTALYAANAIIPAIIYLTTVVSFAAGLRKLPATTTFSLQAWHWPVVVLAILWLIIEIGILTIPEEFRSATYVVGGVLAVGFLLYLVVGRARRR